MKLAVDENFFENKHLELLRIASWAGNLAWVTLGLFVIYAILTIFQVQNITAFRMSSNDTSINGIMSFLISHPIELLRLIFTIATRLFSGIFSYVMLKGISLGLNMIVETDINYREKQDGGVL